MFENLNRPYSEEGLQTEIENDRSFVLLITGPNAVGKGTIIESLCDRNEGFDKVVRSTTRSIGREEKNGETYHFVSEGKFMNMVESEEFVEWERYLPGLYGTTKASLLEPFKNQANAVIEMDVDAARKVKEYLDNLGVPYIDIFVLPISLDDFFSENGIELAIEEVVSRTVRRNRGFDLDPEEIQDRKVYARRWFIEVNEFSYLLENVEGKLVDAVQTVENIFNDVD